MEIIGNHARVWEYDGAFKCLDCQVQWGALPGHPTMPENCVCKSPEQPPRIEDELLHYSGQGMQRPSEQPAAESEERRLLRRAESMLDYYIGSTELGAEILALLGKTTAAGQAPEATDKPSGNSAGLGPAPAASIYPRSPHKAKPISTDVENGRSAIDATQ